MYIQKVSLGILCANEKKKKENICEFIHGNDRTSGGEDLIYYPKKGNREFIFNKFEFKAENISQSIAPWNVSWNSNKLQISFESIKWPKRA